MALGKVFSFGVCIDTIGCLAHAFRVKGTAGCRCNLAVAPENQKRHQRAPEVACLPCFGSVSQDSLCHQGSLLGTREEHITSFYKAPVKKEPQPLVGPQDCKRPSPHPDVG